MPCKELKTTLTTDRHNTAGSSRALFSISICSALVVLLLWMRACVSVWIDCFWVGRKKGKMAQRAFLLFSSLARLTAFSPSASYQPPTHPSIETKYKTNRQEEKEKKKKTNEPKRRWTRSDSDDDC